MICTDGMGKLSQAMKELRVPITVPNNPLIRRYLTAAIREE